MLHQQWVGVQLFDKLQGTKNHVTWKISREPL